MFTSWTLKIYTAHEPFQLSRVVIVRIQSNDTTRGLESTNRVAAAGTQGPHTSRRLVFPPLVCSPSPANNDRAYTRILNYTRGLDTVSLHERAPPIFPLVRRFRESDARTFVHAFSLTTWFICVFTHRWVAIASSVDHAKGKNDSFFKFCIHRCVEINDGEGKRCGEKERNCRENCLFRITREEGDSINKDISIYRASIFLSNVILALASPLSLNRGFLDGCQNNSGTPPRGYNSGYLSSIHRQQC